MDNEIKKTWFVVADGARARVFRATASGEGLESALDADLVASRLPSRSYWADRPGRERRGHGAGRQVMAPASDPHGAEKAKLAHRVAEVLKQAVHDARAQSIVIIAPPQMLGDLRECLDAHTHRAVVAEVDKDLSHLSVHELAVRIPEIARLQPPAEQ